MDSGLKAFLESGSALITDTMQKKSQPVKIPKGPSCVTEKIVVEGWDKVLISRCKDEMPRHLKKADVIAEFKKIIDQEEALI
jgi:hypothetical protein